jgi:hypothetical protein
METRDCHNVLQVVDVEESLAILDSSIRPAKAFGPWLSLVPRLG